METPSIPAASLTPAQQRAVTARGNVLVMAGAGTGKTHTLVQRCLNLICDEQVPLDKILIVTFTEAASAEMRERLRAALETRASLSDKVAEQLALFDAAHIGTLHGFCFRLVREHFHELGLDPQLLVLDEGQGRLLACEILDELFQWHYENGDKSQAAFSFAVQDLIRIYGGGRDERIRPLILRLHNYIQARADAEEWLNRQITAFSSPEPKQWRQWFSDAISSWKAEWLPVLQNLQGANSKAAECREILVRFAAAENAAALFEKLARLDANYPFRQKTVLRKPLESFFDEAKFLGSLAGTPSSENCPVESGTRRDQFSRVDAAIVPDALVEDWGWVRNHMLTLLLLARQFSEKFSARKRADGVLDFHDLEQFSIRLLWNSELAAPTAVANEWRERLQFIFVDEYQDINAAQDRIISALSNENCFLVGDVKQSIYRFRLADPKIFRDYAQDSGRWRGQTLALTENFRSREPLLGFINSLFEPLMCAEVGGVPYDDDAKLRFGSRDVRAALSAGADPGPCAELLLRLKNRGDNADEASDDDRLADLQEPEKEARMVAQRLIELKNSGHKIWDNGTLRAADWRDCAILLRAPGGKAEIFAKQFEAAGVPLVVERGGFYDSSEILDLLSLLQAADNPLQDVPCIAVLRSPFVGCSLDELAQIRLAGSGHFWFALNRAAAPDSNVPPETREKLQTFLGRFSRWRELARQISLSQCLEQILDETLYGSWLLSRPRGAQKRANVQRFLNLAEKFDAFQKQGLFRFLKFVEAQREVDAEPEVAPTTDENAVRLMSIHQSKGLEFPIVVLADLGKSFNEQDLRGDIILDEQFGLCARVKPPSSGGRYPSLAWWLAQKNQRRELRGEEMRLLYVAMTRARDTLLLCGSISGRRMEGLAPNPSPIGPRDILSANSCLDWLALWLRLQGADFNGETARGQLPWLRWRIVGDSEWADGSGVDSANLTACPPSGSASLPHLETATAEKIAASLNWKYPFIEATHKKAKTSVTALRREAVADDEAEPLPGFAAPRPLAGTSRQPVGAASREGMSSNTRTPSRLNAADSGLAHHKFLQHFSFERVTDQASLAAEAARLEKAGYLSPKEGAALDLGALGKFWESDVGKKIRAGAAAVQRELPFTAAFHPSELDKILGRGLFTPHGSADGKVGALIRDQRNEIQSMLLDDEIIVVQGVADLVVLLPREIWLLDFKTDDVTARTLPEKIAAYSPQLKLYASALEKIYSRPVTQSWLHFLSARQTIAIL